MCQSKKIPTFQPTNPSMNWSVQEEKIPRSRGSPARGQKKTHMGPCGWEASSCSHARWVCVPETNSRQGILRDPFSMCSWGGKSCAVRCHRRARQEPCQEKTKCHFRAIRFEQLRGTPKTIEACGISPFRAPPTPNSRHFKAHIALRSRVDLTPKTKLGVGAIRGTVRRVSMSDLVDSLIRSAPPRQ